MAKEFLCILPDKPGVQAKRLEVRSYALSPSHPFSFSYLSLFYHLDRGSVKLEDVKPLVEAGKLALGGAMFDAHPAAGETPSFKGSVLIITVDKEEEAWEIIRNDIYSKADVWDLDATKVIPFKSAVRVGA